HHDELHPLAAPFGAGPGKSRVLNDKVLDPVDPKRLGDPTRDLFSAMHDPRGVIRIRASELRPPLDPGVRTMANLFVSANTFLSAGLVDTMGRRIVGLKSPQGCVPANSDQ